MNNTFKEPKTYYFNKYGKGYNIEYKHKQRLWTCYNIRYHIDNKKYNILSYFKQST